MKQLFSALLFSTIALSASAKTGYLYYAGGTVFPATSQTANDGTPTGDQAVFSVLVANVEVTNAVVTINNWRYATTPANLLPADNPNTAGTTEKYSWMYIENNTHAYNNRIYVGPGDWNGDSTQSTGDSVAYAGINPDGTLGTWGLSPLFPAPIEQAIGAGALVDFGGGNAYVYVLGGNNPGTPRVLASKIQPNGSLGSWASTTPLPAGDWFNRATGVGNQVVITDGNLTAGSSSHYSNANSLDGTLGAWNSIGAWASVNRWAHAMTSLTSPDSSKFVVVAGGNGPTTEVFTSKITAGVPGAWTATNPLPVGKRQIACVGIDDVIIVLGGADAGGNTNVVNTIQVGRIDNSGVITWTTSTTTPAINAMLQPRAFGGAAFQEAAFPNAAKDWKHFE